MPDTDTFGHIPQRLMAKKSHPICKACGSAELIDSEPKQDKAAIAAEVQRRIQDVGRQIANYQNIRVDPVSGLISADRKPVSPEDAAEIIIG